MQAPPLRRSEARIPETKPVVAAAPSGPVEINSCTAPKGNEALGNAFFINPSPASTAVLFTIGLKPCKGRISFCNWAIISAFVPVISA